MAARSGRLCDICEVQHLTNKAEIWCPQCEQALCSKCKVHHEIAGISKTHETIPIEDYCKLPESVQQITLHCDEHSERFEYFCSSHDTPCCVKCINSIHKNCKDTLTPLHEAIENVKSAKVMLDLENSITDLQVNIQKVLNFQTSNMDSLSKQKLQCQKEIRETRQDINKKLDELEQDILDELSSIYTKHNSEIEELITDLKSRKQRVDESECVLSAIKQYATEFQTYLSIRDMTREAQEEENYLQSLRDNQKLLRYDMRFIKEMDVIENKSKFFGKLEFEIRNEDVAFTRKTDNEAQIFNPRRRREVGNVTMSKILSFKVPPKEKNVVWDCFVSDDGLFIATNCDDKCLHIFESDGTVKRDLQLLYKPIGVTQLNKQILVIYSGQSIIHVIDLTNFDIVNEIKMKAQSHSIYTFNSNIFIGLERGGFLIIDIKGNVLKEIQMPFQTPYYIVVANDTIYLPNWDENKIVCLDTDGNQLFEMFNEDLKAPLGITSDFDGNLYVVGFRSNNVFLFSKDGQTCKELIPASDKILYPRTVNYNDMLGLLMITTITGEVFIYKNV
jgi:WD40 repeat protein